MSTNDFVASKMENIKNVFQDAKEYASKQEGLDELIGYLETKDPEFRSVAFEGASMELGLQDFLKNNSLKTWKTFMTRSKIHAPQVHIGLGWAIAQEKHNTSVLNEIESNMLFRVWDGCGYYDGIFRQRQTIKSQNRLDYIPEKDFQAYDQGLGRSLWYICKGDESKIPGMIQPFPPTRHSNLWRGIGIACSYVGGCKSDKLNTLLSLSGKYRTQLGIGAALVAKSRLQSMLITKDIELACKIFCNLNLEEAMSATIKTEDLTNFAFESWLEKMEMEINKK